MAENDTLTRKPRKFLFDLHNFDEGHEQEEEVPEEPPPPPPPTFSEEELEAARRDGHASGKREGLAEAAASREKYVADLLTHIETSFKLLFAAESARDAAYETESVALARDVFRKIFPGLNEAHGLSEIERVITRVLESQRQQPEIIVEVMPEDTGDIRVLLERLTANLHMAGRFTVKGNPALAKGDCHLSWNDGGAQRSASALSAEIGRIFQEMLADRPVLHDNKENDPAMDAPPAETPSGEPS